MASDNKFYSMLMREIGLHLYVAAPARVIKVHSDHTADIKPLFKTRDEDDHVQEHSPVMGAPILKHVGTVNTGDVVWVNFADRALDHMQGNKTFEPGFNRLHSINDAVIVGVFQ